MISLLATAVAVLFLVNNNFFEFLSYVTIGSLPLISSSFTDVANFCKDKSNFCGTYGVKFS